VVWKGDELFWIRYRSGYAVLYGLRTRPRGDPGRAVWGAPRDVHRL